MTNSLSKQLMLDRLSISEGGELTVPKNAPHLLGIALENSAKRHSEHGIVYLNSDQSEDFQSYQGLLTTAQKVLAGLRSKGLKPQDKVIFQIERNQDFIAAFWGCILGGFVPVPISVAPTYDHVNSAVSKLHNVWQMLDRPLVLAGESVAVGLSHLPAVLNLEGFHWHCVHDWYGYEADVDHYVAQPDDVALLLLTSGSTGTPKAVMQSHRALLSRSIATAQVHQLTSNDVSVNWFPLEHVVPIVMFHVRDVYLGCQQVHAPTDLVLQSPLTWLELMDRHRATVTWAPNFAYGLINERADEVRTKNWDLSSMRFLINGGEAIAVKQARTFLDVLAPLGLAPDAMYPAWGMSEVSSGITFSPTFSLDSSRDADPFASVGQPLPGVSLRIVNDAQEVVPEGETGLLQVQGVTVTSGYYQNSEANDEAFTQDGWFNTGDLAFLKDGALTITGRQKGIIIVNGANYYSHEIEAVVEELADIEVSYTAACPVVDDNAATDKLAIFFHTHKTLENGLLDLLKAIRVHVIQSIGLNPTYLIPVETLVIPKTSIGKIQRKQLKKRFEHGEFRETVEQIQAALDRQKRQTFVSGNAVEQDVAAIWQDILQVPAVGIHDNFFELGGNSLSLIQVQAQLQQLFDTTLSIVDLFKYPTIHTLVTYLTQKDDFSRASQQGQVRAQRRAASVKHSDVAVIGMACRYPGAETASQFWQNLSEGVESISFFSTDEILSDGIHAHRVNHPNYVKAAPILDNIETFDAHFFGYSERQALLLDPQQRIFLECAWEALEDAGYDPKTYPGSIGMYAGAGLNTYLIHNVFPNRDQFDADDGSNVMTLYSMGGFQVLTSSDKDFLPTRVSYKLNLKGPSLNIQTACSTSLVAIHTAYQSVVSGECDMALAGGVSVTVPQKAGHLYEADMILSPDGHCRAFDAEAQGTIFGNGSGIVLLKRLEEAIADGDHIYCVIKGSALNNDGAEKVGYAATTQEGQAVTVAEAIALAGIEADTITYFEAHGTGTAMGDPIELAAMTEGFRATTTESGFCAIGSVKTNVGHLQIASGVAGFMKAALALKHRKIPATLHFKEANPLIDFANSPFYVNTELQDWDANGSPRRAGVKSLGIGGTNACLILEEAPVPSPSAPQLDEPLPSFPSLLTLSAKTPQALVELAERYRHHLSHHPDLELADIAYTTSVGRSHFSHRLAAIASCPQDILHQLNGYLAGEEVVGLVAGDGSSSHSSSKIAFLFSGQGAQSINMGWQLYQRYPVFRDVIDACHQILDSEFGYDLLSLLYPQTNEAAAEKADLSRLNQTEYTQPTLFAVEYALYQLWDAWGVRPDVVIGHSLGEYVAACVAGVFSLEDGLRLIAHRGKLMQQLPTGGAMVAVMASADHVAQILDSYPGPLSIAAINGPLNTVISGSASSLERVVHQLDADGIKTKYLQVSHAFHSPLMEPVLSEFEAIAQGITYQTPKLPLITNLTGTVADEFVPNESIAQADYWVHHIRQPVRFADAIQTSVELGCNVFLEIGPHPTLLGMGRQCVPDGEGVWLPSLRPGIDEQQQMLLSLGQLYVQGATLNGVEVNQHCHYQSKKVSLPTYPFQRERYWIEAGSQKSNASPVVSDMPVTPMSPTPSIASVIPTIPTTPIVNLLSQGNIQALEQQLRQAANFSSDQLKLLPDLLKVLSEQHQQQLGVAQYQDWFYTIRWDRLSHDFPVQSVSLQTNNHLEHWIILADATAIGERLAQLLRQQGHECSLVYSADSYEKQAPGSYQVNPGHPHDFARLYRDIYETSQYALSKVIHLWSLDAPTTSQLTHPALAQAQYQGCGSVLHLLQGMLDVPNPPQLWIVTRGTQSVPQPVIQSRVQSVAPEATGTAGMTEIGEMAIATSPLWGLGRVIPLEYPQLWGGLMDLDSHKANVQGENNQGDNDEVEHLFQLLTNDLGEDHLALRGAESYAARLVHHPFQPSANPLSLSADATYWVTGGLGVLGLQTAQWLVEKGAKTLVLMGRQAPSAAAQKVIQQLEQKGTQVRIVSADISVEQEVAQVVAEIQASLPPLKGIIHAAGVIEDGTLQQMSWDSFSKVMAPKVLGAWHLHQLTASCSLDFFVCFSSAASLIGSPGQGNYAAANAFMDALGHYRHGKGQSGLTINWGSWDSGMVSRLGETHQQRLKASGFGEVTMDVGFSILEQLIQQESGPIGVVPINGAVLAQQRHQTYRGSLLQNFLESPDVQFSMQTGQSQVGQSQADHDVKTTLLQTMGSVAIEQRGDILKSHLRTEIARLLGVNNHKLPDDDVGFAAMGIDSLMSIDLKNRLSAQLEQPLPTTLAIEYPTIEKLWQYLCEDVMGWTVKGQQGLTDPISVPGAESEPEAQTAESLDQDSLNVLSDEDAEAQLMNTLTSMGY